MEFVPWLKEVIDNAADGADEKVKTPQAICEILAPMLTDSARAQHWLGEQLAAMARDAPTLPAGYADPVCQSLVMIDYRNVHLSLAIISAQGWKAQKEGQGDAPDIIGFADGWTAVRFLSTCDATIQRHVLGQTEQGLRAFGEAPEAVARDQILRFPNATETMRFTHVGSDVIMARLLVRDPEAMFAYECDARTGAVLRVRQGQSHLGRSQMIVSLLRSLGRRDAVAVIADTLDEWPSHLRWHGIREALAINSHAGFALLEAAAARDPDPQLRALACRTRDDLLGRYPGLAA